MTSPVPPDELRAQLRPARELPERRPSRQLVDVVGVDESLRPVIDAASADLAGRLAPGATPAIAVEAAGSVTWSDASCGCPAPGRSYPQVPVDGAYVRLAAAGRRFHYHAGGDRAPFLCDH